MNLTSDLISDSYTDLVTLTYDLATLTYDLDYQTWPLTLTLITLSSDVIFCYLAEKRNFHV